MTNEEKILEALANMQTQMDARFNKVDARFDQADARFDKLESDVSELKTDVSGLKGEVAAINLTLEQVIDKKLNLLAEGHQTLLETLAPKSRVEQLGRMYHS